MGKNTVKAKQWFAKHYRDSASGKSTIIDWYAEFKRDRTNTDDAECSGRPKSEVVPENIKKVHKIVLKDCKVKLHEIADTLKISESSAFTILHENLSMHKLLSKWVPSLVTPDQKKQRIDDSECCLELFKRDKKNFLGRYVTMDETWILLYYYKKIAS
ncbi:protein GVQW3-like [Vespa mandarinia]|uniref:protein GVQW3-like n=1 Tax=Vespa mandarinia TaxID=7446 RepID=UPI001613547E|nr:protein GVQW3-like [Vespa mandarinia]